MFRRVASLLRAHLASTPSGGSPVAALLTQALVASFFCALVNEALAPFVYGLFALTLTAALIAAATLLHEAWPDTYYQIVQEDGPIEWATF